MKRNFERVKEILKGENLDDARLWERKEVLLPCDAAYICNAYLKNNMERDRIAAMMGFAGRCAICANSCKGGEYGMHSQNCRRGVLAWLEAEA